MKCLKLCSAGFAATVVVSLACCVSAPRAWAADHFIYEFREVFGGAPPQSTPPWVLSEFSTAGAGEVELTISALNLFGGENLRMLYLNLNPDHNPKHLDFAVLGGTGMFATPTFQAGKNAFKAGGDGYYDVLITFPTDLDDQSRFTAGDSITIGVTGIPSLTASDFSFLSNPAGGYGPFYAAAHIQRIGENSDSGWIYPADGPHVVPVPEPASGVLMGAAVLLLLARRFWNARC